MKYFTSFCAVLISAGVAQAGVLCSGPACDAVRDRLYAQSERVHVQAQSELLGKSKEDSSAEFKRLVPMTDFVTIFDACNADEATAEGVEECVQMQALNAAFVRSVQRNP